MKHLHVNRKILQESHYQTIVSFVICLKTFADFNHSPAFKRYWHLSSLSLFFCQKPNFCFTMPGLRKTDSALPLLRCQTTSFLSISNSYYSQIILDFPLQRQSLPAVQSFPLFPCVAIYKYDDEFGIKGM